MRYANSRASGQGSPSSRRLTAQAIKAKGKVRGANLARAMDLDGASRRRLRPPAAAAPPAVGPPRRRRRARAGPEASGVRAHPADRWCRADSGAGRVHAARRRRRLMTGVANGRRLAPYAGGLPARRGAASTSPLSPSSGLWSLGHTRTTIL
jgi:hypothetical protein